MIWNSQYPISSKFIYSPLLGHSILPDSRLPTPILYDNTKIAVAWILGGEERLRTRAFYRMPT
jgi:hypothetical protein